MERFYLKRADYTHIDLLYHWANDEDVRHNSFSSSPISYGEHQKWFQEKIESEKSLVFVYYDHETPIGQIRIDIDGSDATLSYSIDSAYRFLGHGKIILQLLEINLIRDYPQVKCLHAKVKHANVASQVKFEQLGYQEILQTDKYIEYKKSSDYFTDSLPIETSVRGGGGIIFLTNNRNTLPLYYWLIEQKETVILFSGKIIADHFKNYIPNLIISYNYRYLIKEDMIEFAKNKVINLHISLLPWNRGAHPNFWSFIENTPKGVTIHKVSKEVDQGDILIQEEFFFDENIETLKTTYRFLHEKVQMLFKAHWQEIKTENVISQKQIHGGSYHTAKDLDDLIKNRKIDWNENITSMKDKFSKIRFCHNP